MKIDVQINDDDSISYSMPEQLLTKDAENDVFEKITDYILKLLEIKE